MLFSDSSEMGLCQSSDEGKKSYSSVLKINIKYFYGWLHCELVQPMWKTIQRFIKKLFKNSHHITQSVNSSVSSIYFKNTKAVTWKYICVQVVGWDSSEEHLSCRNEVSVLFSGTKKTHTYIGINLCSKLVTITNVW